MQPEPTTVQPEPVSTVTRGPCACGTPTWQAPIKTHPGGPPRKVDTHCPECREQQRRDRAARKKDLRNAPKRVCLNRWTEERIDLLKTLWGAYPASEVTAHLNRRTRAGFSREAVYHRASQLGLDCRTNQGLLTTIDAAKQLGIKPGGLYRFLRTNPHLVLRDNGWCKLLTEETWAAVQARYAKPKERCVGTAEASRQLGYTLFHMSAICKEGRIKAHRLGNRWLIPEAEITRILNERKGSRMHLETVTHRRAS